MSEAVARVEAREPSARYIVAASLAIAEPFEVFAAAAASAERLRSLILSLAAQGRLVARSETGETAGELVRRLAQPSARSANDLFAVTNGFALPPRWAWATLSELGTFCGGKTPSTGKSEYWSGDIPWVTPKDMKPSRITDSEDHVSQRAVAEGLALVGEGSLLMVVRSGILRRRLPTAIAMRRVTINQDLKALTLHEPAMAEYIQLMLGGFEPFVLRHLTKIGTTVESVEFEKLAACRFPIPPLAEQHRIVARVEELMKLCDALEAQGRLADEQHARLTSTLFGLLAASESPQALADHWQRIAEHFDLLLDRPEAIDALEQTILQLAVRGRLVPHHESEGSGGALLARHRRAACTAGQRTRAQLMPLEDADAPFTISASWAWARFGEVADVSGGVTLGRKGALDRPMTLPYLRVANVQRGHLNLAGEVKTVTIDARELPRFELKPGDLLITEGGDWDKVGRTCTWRGEIATCLHQNHVFKARGWTSEWLPAWGELYLNSADARRYFAASAKQTTNLASINMTELRHCAFPLPPLAEQHRIVARVDELRRLCAQLRERLGAARQTQTRLADALVAQALP